jgi:hypothetical protein
MIAVFVVLGFVAAGLTVGLVVATRAPFGYQDEKGFHFGPEEVKAPEPVPCRVPQPRLA